MVSLLAVAAQPKTHKNSMKETEEEVARRRPRRHQTTLNMNQCHFDFREKGAVKRRELLKGRRVDGSARQTERIQGVVLKQCSSSWELHALHC